MYVYYVCARVRACVRAWTTKEKDLAIAFGADVKASEQMIVLMLVVWIKKKLSHIW